MDKKGFIERLRLGAESRIKGGGNICRFGALYDNGEFWETPYVCHATLPRCYSESVEREVGISVLATSIEEGYLKAVVKEEDIDRYYEWLVNDSPFSPAALCITDDAIEINPEAPSSLVGGLCVASRVPWEFPQIIKTWVYWVNEGYPGAVAFIIAHESTGDNGHTAISYDDAQKSALNFCRGVHIETISWLEAEGNYGGFSYNFWERDEGGFPLIPRLLRRVNVKQNTLAPWGRYIAYTPPSETESSAEERVAHWFDKVKGEL